MPQNTLVEIKPLQYSARVQLLLAAFRIVVSYFEHIYKAHRTRHVALALQLGSPFTAHLTERKVDAWPFATARVEMNGRINCSEDRV